MRNSSLRALFWWERVDSYFCFSFWSGFKSLNVLTTSFYRWGLKSPKKSGILSKASQLAGSKTRTESPVFEFLFLCSLHYTTLGNLCTAERLPVLCSCFSRLCLTSCVSDGAVVQPGMFTVLVSVSFSEATRLLLWIWVKWSSLCLFLNSFVCLILFSIRTLSGRGIVRSKSLGPWKKYRRIWGDFRWGGLILDGKEGRVDVGAGECVLLGVCIYLCMSVFICCVCQS